MDWKNRDIQFIQDLPIETMVQIRAKIETLIA
jgi:hypothetical protein